MIDQELLNAQPTDEPHFIFLDQDTPNGLFYGYAMRPYWVVNGPEGKMAIDLDGELNPLFAVTPLTKDRLDFGWPAGPLQLHLDYSIPSPPRNETGIIQIEDTEVSMVCVSESGETNWVTLGVYEPEMPTGLFFSAWRVIRAPDGDETYSEPVAQRHDHYSYPAEAFEPTFLVKNAERIELVIHCTE